MTFYNTLLHIKEVTKLYFVLWPSGKDQAKEKVERTPDLHGFLQSESSARVVNSSSKETFVTHSSAVCIGSEDTNACKT